MKIAVLTIGDEILSGFTVNTNSAWIGQELLRIGAEVNMQITVPDNKNDIIKSLNYFTQENYDHVIVTGGLGPTHDDVTPSTFYQYFNSKPIFDEEYWEALKIRFANRNIAIPEKNRNQATRPDNGDVLLNPVGSARGLHYLKNGINYYALPGVPSEMKAILASGVISIIEKMTDGNIYVKTIRTIGKGESAIAEEIENLLTKYHSQVKVAFLPQLGKVDIRLSSKDKIKLNQFDTDLKSILGDKIYGYDGETIEDAVSKLLVNRKMTIATAESCTGGLLAHRLTNVAGSSSYMLGGIVCYSNEVKIDKVGVKKETIIDYGAVSEQTAKELAVCIKNKFHSDIGVGITGVAGPGGGSAEKPVGLVYLGLAVKDEIVVRKYRFVQKRLANKLLSSQTALNMIRLKLLNER